MGSPSYTRIYLINKNTQVCQLFAKLGILKQLGR